MSTTTDNTTVQDIDELDRQIKQAEMIRKYLQVTNLERNSAPIKPPTPEIESHLSSTTAPTSRMK
jgi:hypothetical protein